MTRHALLKEITGLIGDVMAAYRAEGVKLDERTLMLLMERFAPRYLALPLKRSAVDLARMGE